MFNTFRIKSEVYILIKLVTIIKVNLNQLTDKSMLDILLSPHEIFSSVSTSSKLVSFLLLFKSELISSSVLSFCSIEDGSLFGNNCSMLELFKLSIKKQKQK